MASPGKKPGLVQRMKSRSEIPGEANFLDLSDETSLDTLAHSKGRKSYGKDKKPYRTDAERETELRNHRWTRKIEPRRVLCGHCNTWVKLRNTTKFCPTPWYIHISKCEKKNEVELKDWTTKTNRFVVPSSADGSEASDSERPSSLMFQLITSSDNEGDDPDDSCSTPDDDESIKHETDEFLLRRSYPAVVRAPTPPWMKGCPSRDVDFEK